MKSIDTEIYNKLNSIYERHRKKYKGNSGPKQMCCMWSTLRPPDIIEGTAPIRDIEKAFNISLDEDDCLELYDMDIEQAVAQIDTWISKKC